MQRLAHTNLLAFGAPAVVLPEVQELRTSELDDIDSLVRTYRAKVFRYVVFSIGDVDLAETIVQDCFLKAYSNRASFRGDCSVSTWLMSIATNLVRDQVRTQKFKFWKNFRSSAADVTEMAQQIASRRTSAEGSMLAAERVEQVREALTQLSDKQRTVFVMRFLEEMELSEIAEATGMPVNTVKTHLHRAVTSIRGQLGASR
jgi:RNA polymerase sigma-70 factor (ECF subfamily)